MRRLALVAATVALAVCGGAAAHAAPATPAGCTQTAKGTCQNKTAPQSMNKTQNRGTSKTPTGVKSTQAQPTR
jgi:hypothetical protein